MRNQKICVFPLMLFAAASLLLFSPSCIAKEKEAQATDITAESHITLSGSAHNPELLRDGKETTRVQFGNGGEIVLEGTQNTASLYLIWDVVPKKWQLETPDGWVTMGGKGYLHQYVPLPAGQTTVRLAFEGTAVLCELRQLTEGTLPSNVQNWSAPSRKADLLLFPTHADDEFLYFGGAIPTYTAQGKTVQVVYMVNHRGEPHRQHELLNGLWLAGVRNYPMISNKTDYYSTSLAHAKTLYDPELLLSYQVSLIRYFQPQVIIGHDVNGEYGHGVHCLNAQTLQKAVVAAADESRYPESVEQYGAWDTPKTYLHLWPERALVMDWNIPLVAFGGATAFDVATKAFACHASQWNFFRVEQTGPYDCRKFGLFRTTVGDDVEKNDFFEHIATP